jgi:hypothetical protein
MAWVLGLVSEEERRRITSLGWTVRDLTPEQLAGLFGPQGPDDALPDDSMTWAMIETEGNAVSILIPNDDILYPYDIEQACENAEPVRLMNRRERGWGRVTEVMNGKTVTITWWDGEKERLTMEECLRYLSLL